MVTFLKSSRKHDFSEVSLNIEKEKQKYRKYDSSYLNFGLTSTVVGNEENPHMCNLL